MSANTKRGRGTGHFIAQRGTAIALALLGSWFAVAAALSMPDAGYGSAIEFLTPPMNAVAVMLLIVAGLYHMAIGMDEIIADYFAKPSTRAALSFANNALACVLGAAGVFAVLRVSFGV